MSSFHSEDVRILSRDLRKCVMIPHPQAAPGQLDLQTLKSSSHGGSPVEFSLDLTARYLWDTMGMDKACAEIHTFLNGL